MSKEVPSFLRFEASRRVEHFLLFLSFGTLGLTGLIQMRLFQGYSNIPAGIIALLGGIEIVRIIHRVAATLLMLETIYHLVVLGYKVFVLRAANSMLPEVKDAVDGLQVFGYNLGFLKEKPKMTRYNFVEKAEYWAMMWGLFAMGLTGFILWNPIITSKYLPGVVIPAAKMVHGLEALLAVLAIIVWHFYSVHLKMWNWSMINGRLTHEQMEEEHALELEAASHHKKEKQKAISLEVLKRRKVIYFPIAALLSVVMLFATYLFVTAESTAIKTIPPLSPNEIVYLPQTPTPAPTVAPTAEGAAPAAAGAATTWSGGINAMFGTKCGMCHGASGGLSFASYEETMKGGANGAVITAGDAANSPLVVMQSKGGHMGNFTPEELEGIKAWIAAGAPKE
jgi:cytochrome b subunit of formate dehydrogenase